MNRSVISCEFYITSHIIT